MKRKQKWYLLLFVAFAATVLGGVGCDLLRRSAADRALSLGQFQKVLTAKERDAEAVLDILAHAAEVDSVASLNVRQLEQPDMAYFLFKGGRAVFWTNHQLNIDNVAIDVLPTDKAVYCAANNAHCVVRVRRVQDYTAVAFIVVKYHYELVDSDFLHGFFAAAFGLDDYVEVKLGTADDAAAIYSVAGDYLFSLAKGSVSSYERALEHGAVLFYLLAMVLLCLLFSHLDWWFGAGFWTWRHYALAVLALMVPIGTCLFAGFPERLFEADMFAPIYYASRFVPSLAHLIVLTLFLLTVVVTFCDKVSLPLFGKRSARMWWSLLVVQLVSLAIIVLTDCLTHDLIYNSSFGIVFFNFDQLSWYALLASLLMFVWLYVTIVLRGKLVLSFRCALPVSLLLLADAAVAVLALAFSPFSGDDLIVSEIIGFFVLCAVVDVARVRSSRTFHFWQVVLITFLGSLFVLSNVYLHTQRIKRTKFSLVAENLHTSSVVAVDVYTQSMLADMDSLVRQDTVLAALVHRPDLSQDEVVRYMNQHYLSSYWNDGVNYTTKQFLLDAASPPAHRYDSRIADCTLQPYTPNFYINSMKNDVYQFVGIFDFEQAATVKRLFLVIYKQRDLASDDVLSRPVSNQADLPLSTAVYRGGEKVFNSGTFVYPNTFDASMFNHEVVYSHRFAHYVYRFDDGTQVVVSERHPALWYAFFLYWTYLFVFYLLLASLIYVVRLVVNPHYHVDWTLRARVQRLFVVMAAAILTLAFATSMVFFYRNYKALQLQRTNDKCRYVRTQLKQYFAQNGQPANTVELNFLTLDLAKLYHTDLHIYDSDGMLIATSRPYIFSKGLCGRSLNPQQMFVTRGGDAIVEEQLGTLRYLASYTAIRDASGKVSAYICMPMFYSSYRMGWSLFVYLAVFINIYLVSLAVSAALGMMLGNKLMNPLRLLGDKLRQLKLDHRNEKIQYSSPASDEIGMLVSAYNQLVDQLDESVAQLAQSERESAWRDVARQIAHEIKNPLTPMKLTIQQLQRAKAVGGEQFDAYFKKTSQTLIDQIDSLAFIASEFSNFARMPISKFCRVDLNAKLESEVELFRNNHENVEITYAATGSPVYISADNEQMTQLFNNLLKNAIQSIPSTRRGKIAVSLAVEGNWAEATVADNGCGISDEVAERLFVPRFTTKSSGMGLGLCIVKNIVQLSQGQITFTSKVDEGTTFVVRFPLAKA